MALHAIPPRSFGWSWFWPAEHRPRSFWKMAHPFSSHPVCVFSSPSPRPHPGHDDPRQTQAACPGWRCHPRSRGGLHQASPCKAAPLKLCVFCQLPHIGLQKRQLGNCCLVISGYLPFLQWKTFIGPPLHPPTATQHPWAGWGHQHKGETQDGSVAACAPARSRSPWWGRRHTTFRSDRGKHPQLP